MLPYHRFLRATALLVVGALLTSCDEPLVAPVLPLVRGLEIFPNPASVRVGEDLLMVTKVLADSGANVSIVWRSSDTRRVRVNSTGIVTGVSVGSAVITATSAADSNFVVVVPVSVQPRYTGVRSITASPSTLTLLPSQTQGIAASVSADPDISRAVRFTTDNPSVATVSATGVVTALSAGLATVTVSSVVDSSVTAAIPVTVRAARAARVSINTVTTQGTNNPVDLLNVKGQVDVLVNIEPGEQPLSRVDLVITNNGRETVVASQTFLSAVKGTASDSAKSRSALTSVIVLSFRSDAFNETTGEVAFRNGATTIKAVAVEVGQNGTLQRSASGSYPAQLNNPDGFVLNVVPLARTITPTILDASGRRWFQAGNGLIITSRPVLFSGRALGTRVISFPSTSPVGSVTSGKPGESVDTLRLPDNFNSPNSGVQYVSGQLPSILASDAEGNQLTMVAALSNGDAGGVLNAQPAFSGTRLEGIRVDNAPPPAPTLTISNAQGNSNNWVNGSYQFASGLSNLVQDAGVGLPGPAGTPTVASSGVQFVVASPLEGEVFAASTEQLLASNTNTEYAVEAVLSDRLGNRRRVAQTPGPSHAGVRFGVDKQAPAIRYPQSVVGEVLIGASGDAAVTSNADTVGGVPIPRVFAVDVIDDRSGLPNDRVGVTIRRFAPPNPAGSFLGTRTCIVGVGTSCNPSFVPFESTLVDQYRQVTVSIDGGSALDGYFTFTATAQDQAGNVSEPITRRVLIDAGVGASAPFLTGLGVSGILVGGDSARFLALATDNVELNRGGILLQYPNLPGTPAEILAGTASKMLTYSTPLLGGRSIGVRFDTLLTTPIAGTHPAFTVANFIRGLEVVDALDEPQNYPGVIAKPNAANAWVTDFAFGGAPSTLAANVPIVSGSVQSPGANPGFKAALGTSRELQKWRRAAGISGLLFEAVGPSGQTVSPFARVLLAQLLPSGLPVNPTVWQVVSEIAVPTGADNGIHRTWRYNFGSLGSGRFLAIGVSASGDAIATQTIVIP